MSDQRCTDSWRKAAWCYEQFLAALERDAPNTAMVLMQFRLSHAVIYQTFIQFVVMNHSEQGRKYKEILDTEDAQIAIDGALCGNYLIIDSQN